MDEQLKQAVALGREHYEKREYDKAERYLARVIASGTRYADIHNMMGVIHHDKGRLDAARDAFKRALEINPSYTEAALNLAVTYNDLGEYEFAQQVYRSAVQRDSRGAPRRRSVCQGQDREPARRRRACVPRDRLAERSRAGVPQRDPAVPAVRRISASSWPRCTARSGISRLRATRSKRRFACVPTTSRRASRSGW